MSVMSAKEIIVITGANTGIGYEAVKALLQSSNYHIFLGSRSLDKGNEAIAQLAKDVPEAQSTVELLHIDVTDDESIGKAFALVQSKVIKVDALINNAGQSGLRDRRVMANSNRGSIRIRFLQRRIGLPHDLQ